MSEGWWGKLKKKTKQNNFAFVGASRVAAHGEVPALALNVRTLDGHVSFFEREPLIRKLKSVMLKGHEPV